MKYLHINVNTEVDGDTYMFALPEHEWRATAEYVTVTKDEEIVCVASAPYLAWVDEEEK